MEKNYIDPDLDFIEVAKPYGSSLKTFLLILLPSITHHSAKNCVVSGQWAICEKIGENLYIVSTDVGDSYVPLIHYSYNALFNILENGENIFKKYTLTIFNQTPRNPYWKFSWN